MFQPKSKTIQSKTKNAQNTMEKERQKMHAAWKILNVTKIIKNKIANLEDKV